MPETISPEAQESGREKKFGANVEIVLKFMRHGEREGANLLDIGREITAQRARESGIKSEDFHAVKAIGSPVDPRPDTEKGFGRALETADIYAQTIAGDKALKTRGKKILSYENLVSPRPYDHLKVYNSFLPENFSSLSSEEKIAASKAAQTATYKYLMELDTPEAENYKREIAGSYAYLVERYQEMTQKLKSDSRVLIPAGSHGAMMEFLLKYALVRRDKDGKEKTGFTMDEDIAQDFDPSEAYNVAVATDEQGNPKSLRVSFDNPKRSSDQEMFLDPKIVRELSSYYEQLHPEI